MRKISRLAIALLMVFVTINVCSADSTFLFPTYTLKISNIVRATANSYEFDIYLLHTNPQVTPYQLSIHQYFIFFNPEIWTGHAPGDSLKYEIIGSDMSPVYWPRNPSISPDTTYLRLAANTPLGAGNGAIISSVAPGTKVVRMKLYTTGVSFSAAPLNLVWKNSDPAPFTREFAYTGLNGTQNLDITTPSTHSVDSIPTGINPGGEVSAIPMEFSLSQNYPNPFNPATKIEYALPVEGKVNIIVYDLTGREMANLINEVKSAGTYSVLFNGSNFASGIYFYRINVLGADNKRFQATKRMVLIK